MKAMTFNEEGAVLQNADQDSTLMAFRAGQEEAYLDEARSRVNLDNWVNDHSHLLRGTDGSVHTELRPDTLITIDGIEMTYEVAKISGLIPSAHEDEYRDTEHEDHEDDEESLPIDHTFEIPQELSAQNEYAEKLIGSEAFESALMLDPQAIENLASTAGVSEAETVEMIEQTHETFVAHALDYAESRMGQQFNEEHLLSWFNSSAVPQSQRAEVLRSLRRGHYNGVEALLNQYQTAYQLA